MRTTLSAKPTADLPMTVRGGQIEPVLTMMYENLTDLEIALQSPSFKANEAPTINPHLVGVDPVFHAEDPWFPIEGTDAMDVIHGTDLSDIIYGHGGHDDLYGEAGADQLYGGDGFDFMAGGLGNDYLYGGEGNDALYGDTNPNEDASDGNDVLSGGAGDDNMHGQGGDDMLIGGSGENYYSGGGGDDLLIGSHAGDTMWGNEGADQFADIGAGDSNIQVFDYSAAEGDQVDGASYEVFNNGGAYTEVYDAAGDLKFTLHGYDADASGINFFTYELEPET